MGGGLAGGGGRVCFRGSSHTVRRSCPIRDCQQRYPKLEASGDYSPHCDPVSNRAQVNANKSNRSDGFL